MSQQVVVERALQLRRGGTSGANAAPIVTISCKNTSGAPITRGSTVVLDTTNTTPGIIAVTLSGTASNAGVVGVATSNLAIGQSGEIQIWGPLNYLKANGTAAIVVGDTLGTAGSGGVAIKSATARFARALEAYAGADNNGVIDAFVTNLNLFGV